MVNYPEAQKRIMQAVGPKWCFKHGSSIPCSQCVEIEREHPFEGRCFDCKREYAATGEQGEGSGCGASVRPKGFYSYL